MRFGCDYLENVLIVGIVSGSVPEDSASSVLEFDPVDFVVWVAFVRGYSVWIFKVVEFFFCCDVAGSVE